MKPTRPVNTAAAIHPFTWLQSNLTQKYWLVVSAAWAHDEDAGRWLPASIALLEFKTCAPRDITCTELCTLLEKGDMVVVASPV